MAKKLKDFAVFSGKRYVRGSGRFKTKALIQKHAKGQRVKNHYVVIDKNKDGWFIWQRMKPGKAKSKSKIDIKHKKKDFDKFFKMFKYDIAKDLKLAYGHDWRDNEDFDTGEKYIEIFMDYDFRKVKNKLKNVENIKYKKDKNKNYRIYLK